MGLPKFEPYDGPGRSNDGFTDHLAAYINLFRVENRRTVSSPRFRGEDTREIVRNLVRAALKNYYDRKLIAEGCKEKGTLETLAWFDRLDEGGFNGAFPLGAMEDDISRRNVIVDSLSRAHELSLRDDLSTRARIRGLAFARATLGDSPSFMPKELSHFAKFRGPDSLLVIQNLARENCRAAIASCKNDERRKKLVRLESTLPGTSPDDTITKAFFKIARVSGLNVRHTESPLF